DADPTSATFETVLTTFQAGQTNVFPGALAVTPDGHTAYANDANTGNLIIFNLLTSAVTVIPQSTLGTSLFQAHIEVTQDQKSLLLVTPTGSLEVFDISANVFNPTLVTTITGTTPTGLSPLYFGTFRV